MDSPFHIPHSLPAINFATGLRWLRDNLDTHAFLMATVTLWNIWNFRNGYYHGSEVGDRDMALLLEVKLIWALTPPRRSLSLFLMCPLDRLHGSPLVVNG